jgi:23S rRNA (cytosine1962-C5)-methyltransferase
MTPFVQLHPKQDYRLNGGHNWVFSNEIAKTEPPEPIPAGTVVTVQSSRGIVLGQGLYHPNALIAVRLYTRGSDVFSPEVITKRILAAAERRNRLLPGVALRRLVYSDSDDLSGLIIDQFGEAASVQIHSAGLELYTGAIVSALKQIGIKAAWMRNDTHLRQLEGLESSGKQVLFNDSGKTTFEVQEHGLTYEINPEEGQKTGFYIDQRENRRAFAELVKSGNLVMDAFCNEGGFALMAARNGATVTAADISAQVLGRAKNNAQRNGLAEKIQFECVDVMKWLPSLSSEPVWDVINLDPPNFAHNRKAIPVAMHAYQKLHEGALRRLKTGGYMITSCCSHHVDEAMFMETVQKAAFRTGSRLNLVYRGWQPPDHAVRVGMPETFYLKCFFFEKLA